MSLSRDHPRVYTPFLEKVETLVVAEEARPHSPARQSEMGLASQRGTVRTGKSIAMNRSINRSYIEATIWRMK